MSPKKEKLVRTSIQLPQSIIDRLNEWPEKSMSEAMREALERYFSATPDPSDAYLPTLAWWRAVGKVAGLPRK